MDKVLLAIDYWKAIIEGLLAIVGGASALSKLLPSEHVHRLLDGVINFIHKLALNPNKKDARH